MSASQLDTLTRKDFDDSKYGNQIISFNLEDVNDDKEQLVEIRGGGRYFGIEDTSETDGDKTSSNNTNVDTIVCRRCFEKGHKEAQCTQVSCSICGMKNDHYASQCKSKASCFHCGDSGHMAKECPYRNQRVYCSTCHSSSHTSNRCPHIWRSYLTKATNKNTPTAYPYGKVFCYNCGAGGHLGDDCIKERVSLFPVGNGSAFSGDNMPPQLAGLYWELFNKSRSGGGMSNRSDIVRKNSFADVMGENEEKKKSKKDKKKSEKKSKKEKKLKEKKNDNKGKKRARDEDIDIELALKKKHKGTKILKKDRDFRGDDFQNNVKRERMKIRKSKKTLSIGSIGNDNRGEFRSKHSFNNSGGNSNGNNNYNKSNYNNNNTANYHNNYQSRGFSNNFKNGNFNFNNNYSNNYNSNSNNGFGNRNFNNYNHNNSYNNINSAIELPKPKRHKAINKDYKRGGRR